LGAELSPESERRLSAFREVREALSAEDREFFESIRFRNSEAGGVEREFPLRMGTIPFPKAMTLYGDARPLPDFEEENEKTAKGHVRFELIMRDFWEKHGNK
jgi:hypothetical protein